MDRSEFLALLRPVHVQLKDVIKQEAAPTKAELDELLSQLLGALGDFGSQVSETDELFLRKVVSALERGSQETGDDAKRNEVRLAEDAIALAIAHLETTT